MHFLVANVYILSTFPNIPKQSAALHLLKNQTLFVFFLVFILHISQRTLFPQFQNMPCASLRADGMALPFAFSARCKAKARATKIDTSLKIQRSLKIQGSNKTYLLG